MNKDDWETDEQIRHRKEIAALVEDGFRYRALIAAAGYWQDGSDETIKLHQDDATGSCIVTAGRKDYIAKSFTGAVDLLKNALDEQNKNY